MQKGAIILAFVVIGLCVDFAHGQPSTQPTAASQPVTYQGKPVSPAWVDQQFERFRGKLFKVKGGTNALGTGQSELSQKFDVVNLLDTNFAENGQPVDVTTGFIKTPAKVDKNGLTTKLAETKSVVNRICAMRGGVKVTKLHPNGFDGEIGVAGEKETVGIVTDEKPRKGETFKSSYVYCIGKFLEGYKFKIAEPLSKDEFRDYLNGGGLLLSGHKEITADQAETMKKTEYRTSKDAKDVVKYYVPVVLTPP